MPWQFSPAKPRRPRALSDDRLHFEQPEIGISPDLEFLLVQDYLAGPGIEIATHHRTICSRRPVSRVHDVDDLPVNPDSCGFSYSLSPKLILHFVEVNINLGFFLRLVYCLQGSLILCSHVARPDQVK